MSTEYGREFKKWEICLLFSTNFRRFTVKIKPNKMKIAKSRQMDHLNFLVTNINFTLKSGKNIYNKKSLKWVVLKIFECFFRYEVFVSPISTFPAFPLSFVTLSPVDNFENNYFLRSLFRGICFDFAWSMWFCPDTSGLNQKWKIENQKDWPDTSFSKGLIGGKRFSRRLTQIFLTKSKITLKKIYNTGSRAFHILDI